MCLPMKNFLEIISLIITPISFVVSLITLHLSLKIKQRVSTAVDRNKLSLQIDDLTNRIDFLRCSLDENVSITLSNLLIKIKSQLRKEVEHYE